MRDNFNSVFTPPPAPQRRSFLAPAQRALWKIFYLWVIAQFAVIAVVMIGLIVLVTYTHVSNREPSPSEIPTALRNVHSLGVNAEDGALYAATTFGFLRVESRELALRLSSSFQNSTGFIVIGPDEFLASGLGVPRITSSGMAPREAGLIHSTDAGHSWQTISLRGEALFTTLNLVNGSLYGYDEFTKTFRVSGDIGKTWEDRSQLDPLLDFVVSSAGDGKIIATSEAEKLIASLDGGATWQAMEGPALVYLEWPSAGQLWGLDAEGGVHLSGDSGLTWELQGAAPGVPSAFLAGRLTLYAALKDERIFFSADGGRTWDRRYQDRDWEPNAAR